MARSKQKRKVVKSIQNSSVFGPIKRVFGPMKTKQDKSTKKNVPHKASSHRYKRHPARESHPINLRRHMSKETRVPVKQIKFQLKLPTNSPPFQETPWYREGIAVDSSFQGTKSSIRLPMGRVSEATLSKLDQELLCFADYVRLSPEEQVARDFVIQHVTDIASTLFSNGQRRQCQDVKVQAFGSYATPEVCTFASDVDLALWGVVPVPNHIVFSSTDAREEETQTSNEIKNYQLQKWKDALAELDAIERENENALNNEVEPAAVHINENAQVDAKTIDQEVGAPTLLSASIEQFDNKTVRKNEAKPASIDKADTNENVETAEAQAYEKAGVSGQHDASSGQFDNAEEVGELLFVIDREGTNEFGGDSGDLNDDQDGESRTESSKKGPQHESQAGESALSQPDDATKEARASISRNQPATDANLETDRPAQSSDEASLKRDGSASAPLIVDDDSSDHRTIDLCSDSDADTADKLESYDKKSVPKDDDDDAHTVSLSLTESVDQAELCEDWADEDEPEVSFVSRKVAAVPDKLGPLGENRKLVISALMRLSRALWKSSITHTVEVRKHARVPIITTGTHLGFEGDIAMGGHNGADTSQYASSQAKRFKSFAPVVLLLKVLLAQQALDKPFTGGLGSYKLYVLVAHHLEEHMALGGADRPSEVLLTFFFRFRKWRGERRYQDRRGSPVTHLSLHSVIHCDGGSAELQPVFKLEHCCRLFDISLTRLINELQLEDSTVSFLGQLVKAQQLCSERNICQKKASQLGRFSQSQQHGLAKKDREASVKYSFVFSNPNAIGNALQVEASPEDANADELMAGYGMKRGPRGGLIPRNSFESEARQSVTDVVGRALKNRKNKKKQKRDQGLKSIALREAKKQRRDQA